MRKKRNITKLICLFLVVAAMFSATVFSTSAATRTFLRGDANGDGRIGIDDVTLLQRVIAGLEKDPDNLIKLRAEVKYYGVDIFDATEIQKYIAQFDNIYNIGEKVTSYYDEYELPFIPD